jgi:FKBP-type peptidyl-prolyl cis-trans isomerase
VIQTVGGGEMIDGWEEILPTMRVGERARIEILNPDLGYGSIGVVPIIPPNAALELDMEVLESKPRSVVDFDTLSLGDPNTPVGAFSWQSIKF